MRRDPKEDLPHKPAMPPEAESGAAVVAVVGIIGLWGRRKMPQRVGPQLKRLMASSGFPCMRRVQASAVFCSSGSIFGKKGKTRK